MAAMVYVGCAGWAIPREGRDLFPAEGSHLERYAARLPAVEINSSFYRPHREATYARWGATVPPGFRFAVKIPRTITHDRRLTDVDDLLAEFLPGPAALGDRLGALLIQLPPSLEFDPVVADAFLGALRKRYDGAAVLEPRHPTWFEVNAASLLQGWRIGRVAADPPRDPRDGVPGGWPGIAYHRLHGSPRIYYSAYPAEYLARLAECLAAEAAGGKEAWCMFDNTVLGAASRDALWLLDDVTRRRPGVHPSS